MSIISHTPTGMEPYDLAGLAFLMAKLIKTVQTYFFFTKVIYQAPNALVQGLG
jgi:hypothetical protein